MTTMKKLVSLLLAAMMLLAVMNVAVAEGTNTTVNVTVSVENHTFEAYRIFAADSQDTTSGALGNVEWGTGINSSAFLTALQADSTFVVGDVNVFKNCTSAQDVADALAVNFGSNDSAGAKQFAKLALKNKAGTGTSISGETTSLPIGYYLIVDTTSIGGEDNDAKNAALLQVTDDITIGVKTGVPTVEKKVKDINDSTGTESEWQDSADYDIGDIVPFQLTATLPQNLEYYDSYTITFHDTLSAGFMISAGENNPLEVFLGETKLLFVNDAENENGYTLTVNQGKEITIAVGDLIALGAKSGDTVTVKYYAKLTGDAVIGSTGNDNSVYLTYSNNPDGDGTGKTPTDVVTVFTYQLTVNKTDGEKALAGAGFTLYKQTGTTDANEAEWTAVGAEVKGDEMTTFTWKGLDDGNYKLVETTTPAGYNTADPIEFTISAEHDAESVDPQLTEITVNNNEITVVSETEGEISGKLTTTVVNNSGATLPSTGGIGTTIFYVAGGVLVLLAVVLLVTKRRVGEEN